MASWWSSIDVVFRFPFSYILFDNSTIKYSFNSYRYTTSCELSTPSPIFPAPGKIALANEQAFRDEVYPRSTAKPSISPMIRNIRPESRTKTICPVVTHNKHSTTLGRHLHGRSQLCPLKFTKSHRVIKSPMQWHSLLWYDTWRVL